MTEVAFHFNAPNAMNYACRFARKALRSGVPLTVVGSEALLQQLSQRLWHMAPHDFVAHAGPGAAPQLLAASPIVLVQEAAHSPHAHCLLNLCDAVPAGHERFAKLVEIVALDADDASRAQARARWKHYASLGLTIVRHDLQAARQ